MKPCRRGDGQHKRTGAPASMDAHDDGTFYQVCLSVPRRGGWRAWGPLRAEFGRRLSEQEGMPLIAARVDSEVRRGRDYVRVVTVMTVGAADVAEALDLAWWAFRNAAGTDAEGWDRAGAMAEVRPE